MVYTKITLIMGVVVDRANIGDFCEVDEDGDIDTDDGRIEQVGRKSIEVFSYSCCSDSNGKTYLVGIGMREYDRFHTTCAECPEYLCCNTCIGQTNNGHYDVEKILEGPIEANIRHVCLNCFADNRVDLEAPRVDAPIVDGRCQVDPQQQGRCCRNCNVKPDQRYTPENLLKRFNFYYEALRKLLDAHKCNAPIKFYYMVNDCLSCS